MKFDLLINSSFHKLFLCGIWCCFLEFYSLKNFFQNRCQSFQTLMLLRQRSLCNIPNPLLSFNHLHNSFTKNRFRLMKSLSFLIHKKQLLIHENFMRFHNSVTAQAPLLILYFHYICSYFLHWNLEPLNIINENHLWSWNQLLLNSCWCW